MLQDIRKTQFLKHQFSIVLKSDCRSCMFMSFRYPDEYFLVIPLKNISIAGNGNFFLAYKK